MGKKSTPAAPAVPDYTGAAQAQGAANLTAAQQGSVLSNPNIYTPYGNQTVTYAQDPNLPGGGSQATVTQSLTPAAQANLDAQQQVELAMSKLGLQGVGTAQDVLNSRFKPTNQNPLQSSVSYGSVPQGGGAPGGGDFGQAGSIAADKYGLAQGFNADQYGRALQGLDLSGVAKMPVNAGTTGQAAIMQRLAPQLQRQSAATEQRLANQGIMQGSEAYTNAMTDQSQQQNDLLSQAALQGINLDMGANQQGFNQAVQQGGFYNSGLGQNFGQGLQANQASNAAVGQNYGQGLSSQQLQNAAIGQNFNQAMQSNAQNYGQLMGSQNQGYNQALQSAQFGNAAQQAQLQQDLALRNQPLNEINALMSSSQIQNPQFQAYAGQNVNAAPVFQGVQAQAQNAQDVYGQQMAARNANMQALGGMFGSVGQIIASSDRRLKSNIKRVGTHELGIGIYEYDIFDRRERGVMAQELLEVKPEAVYHRPDGYMMVDYGAI